LKSIADPTQITIHPTINNFRLRYVTPNPLQGIGTRSPVLTRNVRIHCELKGACYFARNFSTIGPIGSSEVVTQELKKLRESSAQNNIAEVNSIVKSLLGNPDF
jgi:hypothetical protein